MKTKFIIAVFLLIFLKGYSQQMDTIRDARDGQIYKTIKIGNQTWMAQNLNFKIEKYSITYKNKEENGAKYGRLYNLDAALTACPSGWHVPTDEEWTVLTTFLGGENVAGGKLKEKDTLNWHVPNAGATNISGFNALPAGYSPYANKFNGIGGNTYFWSSTVDKKSNLAWIRTIYSISPIIRRYTNYQSSYFSCRCLKN